MENKQTKKPDYPVIEMRDKGRIILPNHIITQINYLHGHVGKTEWSGLLFYDVKKGSPAKPKDFVLEVKDIFLMDIGTAGYTEYEPDEDIVDFYNARGDEAMEWKMGHIHTHHNMSAFFSGTDKDELQENVDKHNYYLSLIVNFSGNYEAKVAFLSDVHRSAKMNYTDDRGKKQHFKTDDVEKAMVTIDMSIYYDYDDDFFYNRYDAIVKKKAEIAKAAAERNKNKSWSKGKRWDSKNQEWVDQEIFSEDDFKALPSASNIDADPGNMTVMQVEKLARNVFAVVTDLSETRSTYQILHQVASAKKKDLEFYYDFLADNMETIIEGFFDQALDADEMKEVVDELDKSLIRFTGYNNLKVVIDGVSSVLREFGLHYVTKTQEEELSEQLEEEALARELEIENAR